jgi:hypothetical protein
MTPAVYWYFRRRIFWREEYIPKEGPLVLLGSHSASFLDAIVMGVMMKRPIYFYVRGDIFGHPVVRWIFAQLHMIPVFSADLAKQHLQRNAASFDVGARILSEGGVLLIFPEGISRLERNLMPFRKSPARIILQALQLNATLQIQVVPVGIHFSRHAFRGDLQIVTGEVISVDAQSIAQLFPQGEEFLHSPRAVSLLTRHLDNAFEKVVLYVKQDDRSLLLERSLHLLDTDYPAMDQQKFIRQRAVCSGISEMSEAEAAGWHDKMEHYFQQLTIGGWTDGGFRGRAGAWKAGWLLMVSFPVMAIGWLFHFLPYRFGKYMADTRVTRQDFYTSVQLSVSAVGYLLWLVAGLLIWSILKWEPLGWFLLLAPVLGWFSASWMDWYREWNSARFLCDPGNPEGQVLKKMREELKQGMLEQLPPIPVT